MGSIFESIEILSKEKGIDPQIVITAVKDAMLVAARKQFMTNEDLVAEMKDKANVIQIFALKKVVDPVADPLNELTLEQGRTLNPRSRSAAKSGFRKRPNRWDASPRRPPSK